MSGFVKIWGYVQTGGQHIPPHSSSCDPNKRTRCCAESAIKTHHVGILADIVSILTRSISIERRNLDVLKSVHGSNEFPERTFLILRERLGREHVQGGRFRVLLERFHDGELVDERFAGRGRSRDDDVPTERVVDRRVQGVDGKGLMRVELARFDVFRLPESVCEVFRQFKVERAWTERANQYV